MGRVFHLSCKDGLSVFGLHLHPFEGRSIPRAKLSAYYYPVDRPCTRASLLYAVTVQCSLSIGHSRMVYLHPMECFP